MNESKQPGLNVPPHPTGPFLPSGPLEFVPEFARACKRRAIVLKVLALAFVTLSAWTWLVFSAELRQVAAVWESSTAIDVPAQFDGQVSSRMGLGASYRGTLSYRSPGGEEITREESFSTLYEIDDTAPTFVRGEPDKLNEAVFSWAADNSGARWATLAAGDGLCLLFAAMLWFWGTSQLRRVKLAAALEHNGEEQLAKVVTYQEESNHGKVTTIKLVVDLPVDGGFAPLTERFPIKKGGPCLVPGPFAVVLTSKLQPGRALVLRGDLWPLKLTNAQRTETEQRIQASFDAEAAPST